MFGSVGAGETPTLSPVTMCNGQPPYSSPSSSKAVVSSPRQFLSVPSSAPVQRYDSYQGQICSNEGVLCYLKTISVSM